MIWYEQKNDNDIMVSTRVRIARNLKKYPFPTRITKDAAKGVTDDVRAAIFESNSAISKDFEFFDIASINPIEAEALKEKHFISPALVNRGFGSVMINKDQTTSIMINEEDHVRIQVILPGCDLEKAAKEANLIDDLIEENTEYAFDEELGYLTACPSNVGTGLRASVMMHLPALTLTREMSKIITSAGGLGIAIRGIYGEGSDCMGNLYQISNQVTMGCSEDELISKVENIAKQIEGYEQEARKNLQKNNEVALSDKVWRSYGALKYCRSIASKEAKALISDVVLGKSLGIIDKEIKVPLFELMVKTEPALISNGGEMSATVRDQRRADLIRESME